MSYVIAVLDSETYSLKQNAAIAEVAIVAFDIVMPNHYELIPENPGEDERTQICHVTFPLLEQICLGQDVDAKTIKFHAKAQGRPFLGNLLFPDMDNEPMDSYQCLTVLGDFLEKNKVKELWINHTNFDGPRLAILAEKVGFKMWSHYLEYDLYPFRKVFKLKTGTDGRSSHRALTDCFWNLQVIRALGNFMEANIPDRSTFRTEFPTLPKVAYPDAQSQSNEINAPGSGGHEGPIPDEDTDKKGD